MRARRPSYAQAVRYLYGLQKFGIKFGLSKTSNLLEAFGDPHKNQSYIHIGGTNGKGSVAAFTAAVLRQAGLTVGVYTSPHLVRFTERFKINDREISPEDAASLIGELRKVMADQEPPTFFEATTAMALIYFARANTDLAIMEVGMGGRLDATNVIRPLVSVITNITVEHEQYLGSRLLDIAREKGGIIKDGVDVVTGVTQPAVLGFLRAECERKGASLWSLGRDFRYRTSSGRVSYRGKTREWRGLDLGLQGRFQARNAALAMAVVERLIEKGYAVGAEDVREGLKRISWAGRLQVVSRAPTIVLDGGHNPAALRALRDTIQESFRYKRLVLVIGVMADKQIRRMLRAILPICDLVIYTRPVYPRAAEPAELMKNGVGLGKPGEVVQKLSRAIDRAKELAEPSDLILICGSLFTVGEALTYFDSVTYRPDGL